GARGPGGDDGSGGGGRVAPLAPGANPRRFATGEFSTGFEASSANNGFRQNSTPSNRRGQMATSAQRRLRMRKRKADANIARAKRVVKALTRRLRGANKTLSKRPAARAKIK